jgi:ArsR family metal-binding transcriptional regulator
MGLSKEQIIEIQSAAEFLTLKRIRENQEQREYKEDLADKIAEVRARKTEKKAVVEETEVKAEVKDAKVESKKG